MRRYSLLLGLLGVLLFVFSLPQGCSSPEECDDSKNGGVSLTTLDPNGSPCTKNCDCNNQNYTGVCEPSGNQCKSQERGACNVKGEATPCIHRTQCKDAIKICMPSYLGDQYWGDCMCPPYHCAKEGDCPNGMSCNGTTCVDGIVDGGSETIPETPPQSNLDGFLFIVNTEIYNIEKSTDSAITVWNLKTNTKVFVDALYESSSTMLARYVQGKIYLLISYHNESKADKIVVLDPKNDFKDPKGPQQPETIQLESNAWPSDLVVVGKKAYVTCYTKPYIQVIDLESKSLNEKIDISALTETSTSKAKCTSIEKCLTYSGRTATCEGDRFNKHCKDPAPEAITLRASNDGNTLYILTQGLPPYVENILNLNALNPIAGSQPHLALIDIKPQSSTKHTIIKKIPLSHKYPTNLIPFSPEKFLVTMHGDPIENKDDVVDIFNSKTNTIDGELYNTSTLTASLSPLIDNITIDQGENKAFAALITFKKDKPWELTGESTVRTFSLTKNASSTQIDVLGTSQYVHALVLQSKYLFAVDKKTDKVIMVDLDTKTTKEIATTNATDFLSPMQVLFVPSSP